MRHVVGVIILILILMSGITACGTKPRSGIFDAIERGDHAKLQKLLKRSTPEELSSKQHGNSVLLHISEAENPTPLQYASELGDLEAVRMLVEAGAKPDGFAITIARGRDRFLIKKYLVNAGAYCESIAYLDHCLRLDAEEWKDETICQEQLDAFRAIYRVNEEKAGVSVVEQEPYLLAKAAYQSGLPVVRFLVEEGYPVNPEPDEETGMVEGNTPLCNAAWGGRVETTEYLLSQGADVHLRNSENLTPLEYVLQRRETIVTDESWKKERDRLDDYDRVIGILEQEP